VHYKEHAWDVYRPDLIKALFDRAGVRWALVSSIPDEGTLKLERADPERVIVELRPYHGDAKIDSWNGHPDVLPYLENGLDTGAYVGIGAFHVASMTGDEFAFLGRIALLASAHDAVRHVHSGHKAVRMLLELDPGLTILWAHAGRSEPAEVVSYMMRTCERLYAETSLRASDIAPAGSISPEWRNVLIRYQDRFLIGTDTHSTARWGENEALVVEQRRWLALLPNEVALKIAHENGLRLFGLPTD
jgi:predicted TIM-barrel fold metal-dependent hydrolase